MTATEPAPAELQAFEQLAARRRTSLLMDPARSVEPALVERLCHLATWAPNHKRTWPWRFTSFTGDARLALGEAFAADQTEAGFTDEAKLVKTRRKYGRAPVVLVVGSAVGDSPERTGENRDAVAAAIQTLLLGATAAGLANFWSSAPARHGRRALAVCGWPDGTDIVGVVYLGWPSGDVEVPERPLTEIIRRS